MPRRKEWVNGITAECPGGPGEGYSVQVCRIAQRILNYIGPGIVLVVLIHFPNIIVMFPTK